MGMFDRIECSYPLPKEDIDGRIIEGFAGREFQTKSLQKNPNMDRFKITADGKLMKPDGTLFEFTGTCHFYDMVDQTLVPSYHSRLCHYRGWIEYGAEFVSGQLAKIELIRFEPPESWE